MVSPTGDGVMTIPLLRLMIGALGLLALVTSYGLVRPASAIVGPAAPLSAQVSTEEPISAPSDLQSIVHRDLFRLARSPAAIVYDPQAAVAPGTVAEPPAPPSRPALAVSGILWGRSPSAVLEGVPGSDQATLVRPGDTLGGLHVLRITSATVTVRGFDTTWTLSLRQPW